jgi:hypothetical protein
VSSFTGKEFTTVDIAVPEVWIGGLLGRLLDQQGEEFVFADCRLQVRVSVRRSTRLL